MSIPKEMVPVLIPLLTLQVMLMALALVDIWRREPQRIRGPKWAWAVGSILVNFVGPICYFVVGRKD